jgi:surface antigen
LVHPHNQKTRRRSFTVLAAMAALVGSLLVASPAQAAGPGDLCNGWDECDANPAYTTNGYSAVANEYYWNMTPSGHNCTNYVAYMMYTYHRYNKTTRPAWLNSNGIAAEWGLGAQAAGIPVDRVPVPGSVAWWSTGHVSYVETVEVVDGQTLVTVSEDGASMGFRWRTFNLAGLEGDFPGSEAQFIHFPYISKPFDNAPVPTIYPPAPVGFVTLFADPRDWNPDATLITYHWFRGSTLTTETTSSYRVTEADFNSPITVTVTASRDGYATATTSSVAVTPVRAQFTSAPRPLLSGSAVGNGTLFASVGGTWSPTPASIGYQWLRNGSPISGATRSSYTVNPGDYGDAISVRTTATLSGYTTTSKTSNAVTSTAFTFSTLTATISGTARERYTLTAGYSPSSLPSGTTVTYQWYRDNVAKAGATLRTFAVSQADIGRRISVRVTISNPYYTTVSDMSVQTGVVKSYGAP